MRQLFLSIIFLMLAATIWGCSKSSSPTSPKTTSGPAPIIDRVTPDTVIASAVVTIYGKYFGASAASNNVAISGTSLSIVAWSDTLIVAMAPPSGMSGSLTITVGGQTSNAVSVTVVGQVAQVSYSQDIQPIFNNYCVSCHGGNNGLYLTSYADLMSGTSVHGPVIIPGNKSTSVLYQKISSNPPFGSRMPRGGNPLPDPLIQKIGTWIDQGALNN